MSDPGDRRPGAAGADPWADWDVPGDPGAGWDQDPRVQAGVEHLQRAAHEVIAASRALLDVAEELVDAPGGVTRLVGVVGELGELAGRLVRSAGAAGARPGHDPGTDGDPPVQRIPVS